MKKIIPKTTDGCGTFFVIACPTEMLLNFGVPSGKRLGEIMEKPSENGDLRKKMVGFDRDLLIYG
jgi:hypothetical protein